jgi:hypothetical protein
LPDNFSDVIKFREVNTMRTQTVPPANYGKRPILSIISVSALAFFMLLLTNKQAESQEDCAMSRLANPPRQLITCGAALLMEREPGTDVTIFERRGSAPPETIMLENGAIFVEVRPGSQPTKIRTPHAIAAVRGTTYVVDASTTSTSVFVIKGTVTVRKPNNASTVTLGPGQGVDVKPTTPLKVNRWGANRVTTLLARFGR